MSYLNDHNRPSNWAPVPALTSLRITPGCVQCGSQMEMDGKGKSDLSGKCSNCLNWISDEDEVFDEFED